MISRFILGDIIEFNISKRILLSFILVTFAISSLDFLMLLLGELGDLSRSYSFSDALNYAIHIMPYRIYDMSAYFCLLSALIGLGSLSDQGEIIASRILGKSFFRIVLASFRPIFILVLFGLLASELWIPQLSQQAEEERALARNVSSEDSGYWLKKDSNIIYIGSIPRDQLLEEIIIYELNDQHKLKGIIKAKSAILLNNEWHLNDIDRNLLSEEVISSIDKSGIWNNGPNYSDFKLIFSHRYLSITELLTRIKNEEILKKKNHASLEFWKKVLQPLVTLGLLFLAASLLFGPMRDNKGGIRLFVGISIALVLDLLQKLFGSISLVTDLTAFWAVMLPIFCIFLIASLSFRRL